MPSALRPPRNAIADLDTGHVTTEWLSWLQSIADAAAPSTTTPPGTPPPAPAPEEPTLIVNNYGSGTAGAITKWLAATTLGDSLLSEQGNTVTVAGHLNALTLSGNIDISALSGGAPNAFLLTNAGGTPSFSTSVPFSVRPTVTNAFDLGRDDQFWRTAYLGTSLYIDTLTTGSVLFAGADGLVSQDNANLFWDDSTDTLRLGALSVLAWSTDLFLRRDTAGRLALHNFGFPQELRVYNNFIDDSNFERITLSCQGGAVYLLGQFAGSGSARPLKFGTQNYAQWGIATTGYFLPEADNSYDIGSPTFRVKDLYLAGSLTLSPLTAGSVLFAGAGGVVSQDNAAFFWDDTNNRLGIGTTSPSTALHVNGNVTLTDGYGIRWGTSGVAQLIGVSGASGYFSISTQGSEVARFYAGGKFVFGSSFASTLLSQLNSMAIENILAIGTTTLPSVGTSTLVFGDGTAPSSMGANTAGFYANDVGGTVKMFVIDEAGVAGQIAIVGGGVRGETPTGAVDGVNAVFTTASAYAGLAVYLNGLRQQLTTHYTHTTATTFTFTTAPVVGDLITVDYN